VVAFVLLVWFAWAIGGGDGNTSFITSRGRFLRIVSDYGFLMSYALAILIIGELRRKARYRARQRRRARVTTREADDLPPI
jgi:hypothetical protein